MSEDIQEDNYDACKAKNMGFSQVAETFVKAGWMISVNTSAEISFNHPSDPNLAYDEFRMNVTQDKVNVLIPMPNSKVAYCTWFKDYFSASEYVIQRFTDFQEATTNVELPNEKEYHSD